MNVVIKNRDFSGRLPLPASLDIQVVRYSNNMIGGPREADLIAKVGADKFDTLSLLRCPIEIWDEGKLLWFGFINSATIPYGNKQRIGIRLDEMYNYITVAYTDGDTSANSDAKSIAEFGQKETRLSNLNATQTEAQQMRDLYLADHSNIPIEFEFSGGRNDIALNCYGWYSTLGWQYYTDTGTDNIENTDIIKAIVTASGQFFTGCIIEDIANLTSAETRNGHSTALTYINELLNAGTSNTRPLLAYVDSGLFLHIYERKAKPPTDDPDYLIRADGKLITPLARVVPDKECKVGVWAKIQDAPNALLGLAQMPPVFIENAEYDASLDKTTYTPANSYEQIRLAKYYASALSGQSDGSGGNSSLPIFWTPEPEPLFYNMKHVYTTAYAATDVSGNQYMHCASGYAYGINIGDTGLYEDGLGSGGTYTGWATSVKSYFIVWAFASIQKGTSTPTSGWIELEILKMDVGSPPVVTFAENFSYLPSTSEGDPWTTLNIHVSGGVVISSSTAQGFLTRIVNGTDGDIRVSALNVLYWRVR